MRYFHWEHVMSKLQYLIWKWTLGVCAGTHWQHRSIISVQLWKNNNKTCNYFLFLNIFANSSCSAHHHRRPFSSSTFCEHLLGEQSELNLVCCWECHPRWINVVLRGEDPEYRTGGEGYLFQSQPNSFWHLDCMERVRGRDKGWHTLITLFQLSNSPQWESVIHNTSKRRVTKEYSIICQEQVTQMIWFSLKYRACSL